MKEKICGIYCIENIINNKKYIGWTIDAKDRFYKHKWTLRKNIHCNNYLQCTWNKYGEENFKFWIIEEYPKDEELLKLMEIYFIAYYNSFYEDGKGYNLTRGGEGILGYIHTEEWKKKNSERISGENNPNYGKFGKDNHLYGTHHTDKWKEEQSKRMSGENHPFYGIPHSDEWKKNMSIKMSGENHHMWGTHLSEETRKLQSEAHMGEKSNRWGRKNKNSSSSYLGVIKRYYKSSNFSWVARILINGKLVIIGSYKNEIDAAYAYNKYVIENNINRPLNFLKECGK